MQQWLANHAADPWPGSHDNGYTVFTNHKAFYLAIYSTQTKSLCMENPTRWRTNCTQFTSKQVSPSLAFHSAAPITFSISTHAEGGVWKLWTTDSLECNYWMSHVLMIWQVLCFTYQTSDVHAPLGLETQMAHCTGTLECWNGTQYQFELEHLPSPIERTIALHEVHCCALRLHPS